VLHAPQGDTYADLLFTMIERRGKRPPVTYTTFEARDLGKDTAQIFQDAAREAVARFNPQAIIVGASCTAELIQDDPGGLAKRWGCRSRPSRSNCRAISARKTGARPKPSIRSCAIWLTRALCANRGKAAVPAPISLAPPRWVSATRDDLVEIRKILDTLDIEINLIAPLGATPHDIARIGAADFNIVMYPEIADEASRWLEKTFGQPAVRTVPIGVGATRSFIADVAELAGADPTPALGDTSSRMPWWSRSVDSTYLTGKRVFIFGDATHAVAAARIAREELGFEVCGLGCYNREFARDIRAEAARCGVEPLITDDHLAVEDAIAAACPELVLGTQMERHIAKRLGLPCAVISAPVHVQDFPARHSPQMGFEGANVIFDTWVHPLVMGLEEHLLTMFREDFEFADEHGASHLAAHAPKAMKLEVQSEAPVADIPAPAPALEAAPLDGSLWTAEAERELKKIPFFVRGKAKRNTEAYAAAEGLSRIELETLYDAKAHYAR
jgi:light-independent protochlorophyllide reductase subunit B